MNLSESIPQELRARPAWLVYRKQEKHKVPYHPLIHARAEPALSHGVPYEQALHALLYPSREIYRYDGLGVILGSVSTGGHAAAGDEQPDLTLAGLDIDDCVTDQGIDAGALDVVRGLASYTEFSPSRHGLHVLCFVETEAAIRERTVHAGLRYELYSVNYMTVTGDLLPGAPLQVNVRTEQFLDLRRALLPTRQAGPGALPPCANSQQGEQATRSNRDVYLDAVQNKSLDKRAGVTRGLVFVRRWKGSTQYDNGDLSSRDYNLCSMLSFYCSGTDEQVREQVIDLFLQSGCNRIDECYQNNEDGKRRSPESYMEYLQVTVYRAVAATPRRRVGVSTGGQVALLQACRP